jgi:hypothetical protein
MTYRAPTDMPLGPTLTELAYQVEHYSTREIARRYEVGSGTVQRWCRDLGIVIPRCKAYPIADLYTGEITLFRKVG